MVQTTRSRGVGNRTEGGQKMVTKPESIDGQAAEVRSVVRDVYRLPSKHTVGWLDRRTPQSAGEVEVLDQNSRHVTMRMDDLAVEDLLADCERFIAEMPAASGANDQRGPAQRVLVALEQQSTRLHVKH